MTFETALIHCNKLDKKEDIEYCKWIISKLKDNYEIKESCKDCMYLGIDTDICLKCSHSYGNKFKRMK